MPRTIVNDRPYEHRSAHGTVFTAARCDFATGVTIVRPAGSTDAQFAADVAEMTAQHHTAIWPDLNGFAGYDAVDYTVISD